MRRVPLTFCETAWSAGLQALDLVEPVDLLVTDQRAVESDQHLQALMTEGQPRIEQIMQSRIGRLTHPRPDRAIIRPWA